MPKKKEKRRGFPLLGFLVAGTTIGIGLFGRKAGGVVEPPDEPPIQPPVQPPVQPPEPENGQLFPIGTRIRVKANCGAASGLTGVVTAHIFQRPADRTLNDLSMVVFLGEPGPGVKRDAFRVSENCLERE